MSGEQPEGPVGTDVPLRPRRSSLGHADAGHPVTAVDHTHAEPAGSQQPDPDIDIDIDIDPAPPLPVPRGPLNALAVTSLVLGLLLSPLAALFGHIALGQIRRSRRAGGRLERGRRVAGTAIVLGWLGLVAYLVIGAAVWVALTGVA